MANIVIAKADMKDGVTVGNGWLVGRGWAVRVGDDPRFQSKDTAVAAFKDLKVYPRKRPQQLLLDQQPLKSADPYRRTNVLIEGEDGVLTRVYRQDGAGHVCFNERYLQILGKPEEVFRCASVFSCENGYLACTTDRAPAWAKEMEELF